MTRFPVEVDGTPREAEIVFGSARDAAALSRWRPAKGAPASAVVRDALEFARLASKRWRYYGREGATAASLAELRSMIRHNARAEIAMVLLARATWRSATPVLGFAYVRRSWCNHLIVDFLSAHPRVIARAGERIRNVGTGLVHQLVALADEIGAPCVWGEATSNSAPFYGHALDAESILDHFFIEDDIMIYCRAELQKSRERMLARRVRE